MKKILLPGFLCLALLFLTVQSDAKPIRVLVVTGGHGYQEQEFNEMLASLGKDFSSQVVSFPDAFELFRPENREKYDVLVFYHMWQKITDQQAADMADCIRSGKPLVVLHHSICAFDDWPEYISIIGGKYFHKPTLVNGTEYPACTYKHDLRFRVRIVDTKHPVTKGLSDFDVTDESYYGFYVNPEATPLLTTDEPTSTPVIGWTKKYGKARVVTLQSGHDRLTFGNPHYRKLLKQAILWTTSNKKDKR